jgi:hypothetical protein
VKEVEKGNRVLAARNEKYSSLRSCLSPPTPNLPTIKRSFPSPPPTQPRLPGVMTKGTNKCAGTLLFLTDSSQIEEQFLLRHPSRSDPRCSFVCTVTSNTQSGSSQKMCPSPPPSMTRIVVWRVEVTPSTTFKDSDIVDQPFDTLGRR